MALFKKFKNNIGLDEEEKDEDEKDEEEDEVEKKQETRNKKQRKEGKKIEKKNDWPESNGQLAADIYETDTDFCLQIPIAGVSQEDIKIFVESNMLIIRGERAEMDTTANKKYFHKECYWGSFTRQTMLPDDVNTQKITASFKKGVLVIKIPKKREEKRKINIEMS